jgi:hypothetical protein
VILDQYTPARDEAARRRVSFQDDHASGPGQATSATRRHGRIGHEQIFVAKTRLSAHGGCDEKYRRFDRGELMPPDWRASG